MHLDNLQNASLGNWCMVGYAIGAVIAMVLGVPPPVKIIRFIGKSSPYKFALIASAISCKSAGVSPGFQPMLI